MKTCVVCHNYYQFSFSKYCYKKRLRKRINRWFCRFDVSCVVQFWAQKLRFHTRVFIHQHLLLSTRYTDTRSSTSTCRIEHPSCIEVHDVQYFIIYKLKSLKFVTKIICIKEKECDNRNDFVAENYSLFFSLFHFTFFVGR